jgi:hypothetical protein
MAKPDAATALARRFCYALAEETAGMNPGSGRMVQTMAQRMGITFDEASSIADDCARRDWVDHRQHTVSLREGAASSPPQCAKPSCRNGSLRHDQKRFAKGHSQEPR